MDDETKRRDIEKYVAQFLAVHTDIDPEQIDLEYIIDAVNASLLCEECRFLPICDGETCNAMRFVIQTLLKKEDEQESCKTHIISNMLVMNM